MQLAAAGKQVIATFNKTAPTLSSPNIQFHPLNVLDDAVSTSFPPNEITGMVYCPGSINLKPFERIKPSDFEEDYKLQVVGAVRVIQMILPALRKSENASIVLFSTVAVQTGFPYHAQVAASKGSIEGLTMALAAEFAPTIRVNCIAPSLTNTRLAASLLNSQQKVDANGQKHPLKRVGTPTDIANMALYLLSEKASWITGQIFHVDGGMSSIKL